MAEIMKRIKSNAAVLSVFSNNSQFNERLFNIFTYSLIVLVTFSGISLLFDIFNLHNVGDAETHRQRFSLDINNIREIQLPSDADEAHERNPNCTFWDCLNVYRCGQSGFDHLTIYVYPLQNYVHDIDGKVISASVLTPEYYEILEAIVRSPYYTSNPNDACLFLPSIDMLNQNLLQTNVVNRALAALNHWENGENHLIFNMLPGNFPTFNRTIDVNTDKALILGGGFDTWTYRDGFDISLPVWSPTLRHFSPTKHDYQRRYFLIAAQLNILPVHLHSIQLHAMQDYPKEIILLQTCNFNKLDGSEGPYRQNSGDKRCELSDNQRQHIHDYPKVLGKGTFCLLTRSLRLGQPDLLEMLAYNCIPVIAIDNYVLPFSDIIDWSLIAIQLRESDLHSLMERLKSISHTKILEMQHQGRWIYNRYFKDLKTITNTVLEILYGRIFPHRARSMRHFNMADSNYKNKQNPLFLPLVAPKGQGFTAVILTYDRVESLFTLIQKLALVPSLHSILVIWNNQNKSPPHISTFPSTMKPIKVIQTTANKLSNRFFPYPEIETEAILTIDDDINMLTADELDFGFEVWREFPDRIVGFPSRVHVWDNATMRWRYESEWTNDISMVLTGAAFHHKFWSHMYTYSMPGNIKEWVDEHMNCEDIAMNFLVANKTNKPPIKVTPRKKFKCPECINNEMLSADLNHMRERSACVDRFANIYGHMPLRSVEFRADPVLFKDNFPEKLKRFNDVGTL